jgi:hypothetical protein
VAPARGARRRPAADAAGAAISVSLWVGQGIQLLIKLWWEITKAMRAHTAGWGLGERELVVRL